MGVKTQDNFASLAVTDVGLRARDTDDHTPIFTSGNLTRGTVRAHMLAVLKASNVTVTEESQLAGCSDRQKAKARVVASAARVAASASASSS